MIIRGKSANFYLGLLVAGICLIAIVVAVSSSNSVKTLQKGSAEEVVQSYLQSITQGRNDLAATNFSKESKCTVEDIDRAYMDGQVDITLVSTKEENELAIVDVVIARSYSIFDGSPYQEKQSFRLNLEDGVWKITGIPWPLYDCGGFFK